MVGLPVVAPQQRVLLQIVHSEMEGAGSFAQTGGQYLTLEIDVLDGADVGRKILKRLKLVSGDPADQRVADKELAAFCKATGCLNIVDVEQLHLIPFYADITVEPGKGGSAPANDIKNLQPHGQASGSQSPPRYWAPVPGGDKGAPPRLDISPRSESRISH